ncbi:MAG: aminomethyl-transferring glycine dehydrogenase, partial [Clostridia bacterium]
MGSYIPNTKAEQQEMLSAIGVDRMEALFADIPEQVLCKELLHLPAGQSEMEVRRTMTSLAAQNTVFDTILRGAGAYFHYIPAIVRTVTSKETFVT